MHLKIDSPSFNTPVFYIVNPFMPGYLLEEGLLYKKITN